MGKYIKLNNQNQIENTILAEKEFIETLIDKDKYVKIFTNDEEKEESVLNKDYSLNLPFFKYYNDNSFESPIYNFEKRKFKNPQPYASWTFDEESYEWIPPVPKPKEKVLVWNEQKLQWIEVEV
jgi:hypothetical protein